MELDETAKAKIKEVMTPLITSAATAAIVGAAMAVLSKLLVTDVEENSLTGKKELHPTEDSMAVSKVETAASEKDGKLSQDTVSAQKGDLGASNTDAAALDTEAKAADTGASAARTKAGAADIATKALNMT